MYTKDDKGELQPYDFSNMRVCNSQVAQNSNWFCTGLVGDFDLNKQISATRRVNDKRSLLGIFAVKPDENYAAEIQTWINTSLFSTFFVDDNLTTVMFLDRTLRKLDYHFLLWDFDCERAPEQEFRNLKLLNEGKIPGYDEEDEKEIP